MSLALRDYQEEAIAAVDECVEQRQLVVLPTGTGKTVVFSEMIRRRGGRALVIAHRDELLAQAADKIRTVAPELAGDIGFVQAGRNDVLAPIVIASVQTLASAKRLAQLPRAFKTVVIDEAHHAVAASYTRILEHVSESDLILGFTATAERHDKKTDLRNAFAEMPYARSLQEMIEQGYLCDLRAERVILANLDLSTVKKSRGDYQADALGEALENADAVDHAVAAYLEHAAGTRCVAFFPTVALSKHAAEAFRAAGVDAAHVDGTTDRGERRAILAGLSDGAPMVVSNVGVLTEGFDEPSLGAIIIAAPTKSRIKYAQMVGRGTRLYPGKTECVILDLAGVSDDLSIQSVGVLFGLKKPPKPGETAAKAAAREKVEEEEKRERLLRPGRRPSRWTRATRVNLFSRDQINWVHVDERWIVNLSRGQMLVLEPAGQDRRWRVLIFMRHPDNRVNGPSGLVARIVAKNVDFGYALGAAETIIRDAGSSARIAADNTAAWRARPATATQLTQLRRRGTFPESCTSGHADDLITAAIAAERIANYARAVERRRRAAA